MHPKTVYDRTINGDPLTDEEVLLGREYYFDLAQRLSQCGPVFWLAANEARRIARDLEGFALARGLIKFTAAGELVKKVAESSNT